MFAQNFAAQKFISDTGTVSVAGGSGGGGGGAGAAAGGGGTGGAGFVQRLDIPR